MTTTVIVLIGVSGSGKSTIGALLARELGWKYADGDGFHSAASIAKMTAMAPLSDDDRAPWLESIRAWIDERVTRNERAVVSCSALKRRYRDTLRRSAVCIVYLRGTRAQIESRLQARADHFFKPSMLDSQFAALEDPTADENVISIPIDLAPAAIVDAIIDATESA